MIYTSLFDKSEKKILKAGVIGTGDYATAMITQSITVPRLDVPAISDINIDAAIKAFTLSGIAREDMVIAENYEAAINALESGKRVIAEDPMLLMELPLEVIVEATGDAEFAAGSASKAIEHGKHVVMVTKETDASIGPVLNRMAKKAGLVYTAADGDQPSLAVGLHNWCKELGLEVICGGKYAENELGVDRDEQLILPRNSEPIPVSAEDINTFDLFPEGPFTETVARRRELLGKAGAIYNFEMSELTIVGNLTGLAPEKERLHHPIVWPEEIPSVLCREEEGGILSGTGVLDLANYILAPNRNGMAGGVFSIVSCATEYSRRILFDKKVPTNKTGTAFLISRPYHLCGVETVMSALTAGLIGVPTSEGDYKQLFDVCSRTRQALTKGTVIGDPEVVKNGIQSAKPVIGDNIGPYHLAEGYPLNQDVPADTLLTCAMFDIPESALLWKLRKEQDVQEFK